MAELDKLTGFMTQKYFLERLEHEVLRVKRYKNSLSIIIAEVNYDFFEKNYDVKRHLSYAVLKQVGAIFRGVRGVDLITRYEGDAVVILLPETNESGAKLVAERLRRNVESQLLKGDEKMPSFRVAISVGVAAFSKHARTAHDLVVAAQKGLQIALAKGGNRIESCPVVLEEASP